MQGGSNLVRGYGLLVLGGLAALAFDPRSAHAADEIQLYNAEIAELGQWTIQHHFNYAFNGRKEPDFPGGLVPNHALNATPEFAYGLTDWFELGWYAPWAVDENGRFLSNFFKFRTLFVTPNADKRDFFYGLNFEFDATTPPFSETRFAMEIRPIIGWRNPQWEFIVNPIFDLGFGDPGDVDFLPAARLGRKFSEDFTLALEYYTDLGRPGKFLPFEEQSHQLYAVVDFKIGPVEVDFGLGYGFTPGSDRFLAKTILTYAIPVNGKSQDDKPSMKAPINMKSSMRPTSATQLASDPFAGMR